MSQPIAAFTGNTVYLDTMIPYALLRNIDATAVKALFQRIPQMRTGGHLRMPTPPTHLKHTL
jgi:hypothetical protein